MKPHKMQDGENVILINQFREKYGFSQDQMARLLGINRGQLSHTETHGRQLPVEAERMFITLTERLKAHGEEPGDRDFAKEEQEKRTAFVTTCEYKLIAMQYKIILLKKQLPKLEKQQKKLLIVLKNWNELSESGRTLLANGYSNNFIQQRCLAKFAKCDIHVQLEKKAQIQILLGGIEALTQFLAEYRKTLELEMSGAGCQGDE